MTQHQPKVRVSHVGSSLRLTQPTPEGWVYVGGKKHDVFKHPSKSGRVVVARHREQSPYVARQIAKDAGWI